MKSRVGPLEPGGVRRLSISSVCGHFYCFLVTLYTLLLERLSSTTLANKYHFGHKLLSRDKGRVKAKDLVTGRFLGQGCSGIFYETRWTGWLQGSWARLARKDFPGVKGDIFESEVVRLFELREHPNVVKTLCWTVNDRSCSLVMEYMKDNLSSFVRRKKETLMNKLELDDQPVAGSSPPPFDLLEAMDIALQIAAGVEYLHEEGIPHGDLKPNNVLIDWKEGRIVVKVADFGLIETKRRTTLISQRALCIRMVEWSAPEVLEDYFASIGEDLDYIWTPSSTEDMTSILSASDCDEKIMMELADSYSFALTCTYILGGKTWNTDRLRKRMPSSGCRPELPSECPEKLAALISRCWDANPKRRPVFTDICHELQEIVKEQREREEQLKMRNMMLSIIKEQREQEVQRQQETLSNTLQIFVKEKEKLQEGMLDIRNAMQVLRKDIMEQLRNICIQLQDIAKVVQDSNPLKPMELPRLNPPTPEALSADSSKISCLDPDPAILEQRKISSQLEVMESRASVPGPMPLMSEGLRIIEDATGFYGKFLMNKHQCESLKHRLSSIGEELKELAKLDYVGRTSVDTDSKMGYPAFEMLLTVLRKAAALLIKYRELSASIPSALTRREDRGAFKEINEELDMLNSFFHFESFVYDASESEKNAMMTENADEDLKELSTNLDGLAQSGESRQALELATNLEKVKLVITNRSEGTSDDGLPSYLNIDPASVEIKEPVRIPERLSNHDDEKTDGWVLVRFGAYLGCEFAIKVFKSGDATWNRDELLKEVRSLMALHHPHIVQLMGFAQDAEKCIMLMELMDTDLRHFMKPRSRDGKRPFGRSEEMDIITQIARGLLYLHEQGYVHGELKCSNILVKQIGGYIDVKISDLRSSQKLGIWDPVLFRERTSRVRCRWAAPEVTCYKESLEPTHDLLKKTDVYSFGMVCFEVVTGKLPFQDVRGEALHRRIATGELKQELPGKLDGKLRGLIESCWERDPSARPTLEEICHLLDNIRCPQPGFFASFSRHFKRLLAISRNPRPETEAPQDGGNGRPLTLPDFVRIEPEKLKKERLLGEGASAEVHQVTWRGCKYALKTFSSASPPTEVEVELKCLVELRHPCVVRLIGLSVDQSERRCSIVMEFMGSDLRNLIDTRMGSNRTVPFDLHEAVYIITRIALGMAFLHARGVVHRDLKALNVLIPDHPGSIDVKISDFGMSQLIDPKGKRPLGHVGTRFWRAPELLLSGGEESVHQPMEVDGEPLRSHDPFKAADVYSFGMTSYEVLTGGVPLHEEQVRLGEAVVKQKVIAGELRPKLPVDLNRALKELIEECWAGEPEKRPTFFTICEKLRHIQLGLGC